MDLGYPPEEHEVRLMVNDPVACGWEWIKAYAQNLNERSDIDEDDYYGAVTPEELIEIAMTHIETDERYGGDYISRGSLFEGVSTDPTFWEKLADLKQISIPADKRNNFFSCSC